MVKLDALPSVHPPAILPSIRRRLNDHVQCPLPREPDDPPARAIRLNSIGLIVVPRMTEIGAERPASRGSRLVGSWPRSGHPVDRAGNRGRLPQAGVLVPLLGEFGTALQKRL